MRRMAPRQAWTQEGGTRARRTRVTTFFRHTRQRRRLPSAHRIYSLESFMISDCEAPRACPQAKWLVVREDCATTHACLSSSAANGCGTGFGHLSFSIAVRASVIAGKIDWLRYTRTLSL